MCVCICADVCLSVCPSVCLVPRSIDLDAVQCDSVRFRGPSGLRCRLRCSLAELCYLLGYAVCYAVVCFAVPSCDFSRGRRIQRGDRERESQHVDIPTGKVSLK
jgi:hypothetical protein